MTEKEQAMKVVQQAEQAEKPSTEAPGEAKDPLAELLARAQMAYGAYIQAQKEVARLLTLSNKMKTKLKTIKRNKQLIDCLEIGNMLKTAQIIIAVALKRKESRGAHHRLDFTKMQKKWQKNIIVYQKGEQIRTKTLPVTKL